MSRSLLGIALAALLLGLLWVSTIAQTQPPAGNVILPPEVDISQTPGLILTATVGVAPATCAVTATVQVRADTLVYYCYTIAYTGTQPLTLHRIETARQGLITDTLTYTLQPGASVNTVALGLVITDRTGVDVANPITWTARTAPDAEPPLIATGTTFIDVVAPALTVFRTVGQDSTRCADDQIFRVPSGATAYYCLRIINRGDITLTRHTVADGDPSLNVNGSFERVLPPGESLVITSGVLSSFGLGGTLTRFNVTQPITSPITVTSATDSELTVSAVATTVLDVGITTVLFTKTVAADPHVCGDTNHIVAPPGTQLYYCARILNTGQVTLTHHQLSEVNLSIDLRFDYVLPPAALLTITRTVLTEVLDQPDVFGPLNFIPRFSQVVNNTMIYTGTSVDGITVVASSSTSASFPPTATPTDTPRPRPTSTPRPTFTPEPTMTFTPLPPTDTPTPTNTATPTDTPTPTRDWAVSFVTTPTPAQFLPEPSLPQPAAPEFSIPEATDPVSAQLTAIALAETEIAATATALQAPLSTPDFAAPTATSDLSYPPPGVVPDTPFPTATMLTPDTATPDALVVIVTNTPDPTAVAAAQRPVVLPTPTPTADYLLLAAKSVDAFAATTVWIWFLAGSLVFFVTAGIVAGLFFYQREQQRFVLLPEQDDEFWDDEFGDDEFGDDETWNDEQWSDETPDDRTAGRRSPSSPSSSPPRRPDDWPADLP